MRLKKIFDEFNIFAICKSYGLSCWQCPQFLFLVMGIIIASASIFSYLIGSRYIADPLMIAAIVLILAAILFVIAFIVIRNFERLAELSRMKTEFISIVTHQLRSPLTNLKWTVDFLTSSDFEVDRVEKEKYYKNLRESTGRMIELLDNLLVVSRIEKKKEIPLRKKEVSIKNLLESLVSQFEEFAKARNIKLKVFIEDNLPSIFVDPFQLKIVLENLIDNAIRYSKDGGEVEIQVEKKGKKKICFKIKDTGVGIPKRDQKYIFQKFFRADNVLKEKTRGSGIGLFVAKTIVKKMKGRIWFESEENKGSIFYFTLPIK